MFFIFETECKHSIIVVSYDQTFNKVLSFEIHFYREKLSLHHLADLLVDLFRLAPGLHMKVFG